MLRTRLWMGACLIALTLGMLVFDQKLDPYFPFLLLFFLVLAASASREMASLLGPNRMPPGWFYLAGVVLVLVANWPAHLWQLPVDSLQLVLFAFAVVILGAFLVEIATYREPGTSVFRLASVTWVVAYLGVLPSFLAQTRWLPSPPDGRGVAAVALALFVPKICDIGAYFSGKLFGRHRMTPILSPGKTWQGLVGGLAAAIIFTMVFNRRWPVLGESDWRAMGFGFTVGLAGVFGDLAESLIKRDCRQKDASQVVPGFGGVLDVIDSVVFAAPVAYWWLRDW